MTLSVYLKRELLKHTFGLDTFTPPTISIGLTGLFHLELADEGGYARVETTAGTWSVSANGTITNILPITFNEATIDWEEVQGFVLKDSALWAVGNSLARGTFLTPYYIYAGHKPVFPVGAIEITLDGDAYGFYVGQARGSGELADVGRGVFSDYMEDTLMNFAFGKAAYSTPTIYIGLLTYYPADTATNDDCDEVPWLTTPSYFRTITFPSDWLMSDISFGEADIWNQEEIPFPEATESWGMITAIALFDVSTPLQQGNLLMYGPCPPSTVQVGSLLRFRASPAGSDIQPGIDFFFDSE